ncbi:hypothetical protein DSL72_008050 [Monilinia vaccinii-corymbosi]|uniref:Ubiquitin-like domain-containing protein n=1 Tax=Monilinia vaccinii-corymbosi TaxID=61207 RepID=A0A8A3PJJ3_9HELO|nr:hypothetical protein DSL72_008050 [Monilinia vaccinii-corymbosi]
MSSSPENAAGIDAPTADEKQESLPTFTLSVVSPSVEVASPLTFPQLLATTTVEELKAKIRDVVESKPADSAQRLIHRGRMLERGSQTMLEVFGQENLSTRGAHTLHLVLRPPPEVIPTGTTNPPTQNTPSNIPHPQTLTPPPQLRGAQNSHNAAQTPTERLLQLQRETERLQQELEVGTRVYQSQLGRLMNMPVPPPVTQNPFVPPNSNPTSIQQLIAQHQQRRAAPGRSGAQDAGGQSNMLSALDEMYSGRSTAQFRTPDHSTTYTRQGVGPNGERWQVTVSETTTTVPAFRSPAPEGHNHEQHPPPIGATSGNPDLQNILRRMDRLRVPQAPTVLGSSSTPPSAQPETQTTPSSTPALATTSAPSTPRPTVPPNPVESASVPNLTTIPITSTRNTLSPSVEPVVYILTSPSGPRALLINNSETFYTPRASRTRQNVALGGRDLLGLPEYRNRNAQRARVAHGNRPRANEAAPVEFPPIHNRAQRPAVPVVLQLFNVLWLIVRLVGFVWFFTSGNSSWSRFFMMSGLAVVVFLINTGVLAGLFHGVTEQLWGPIRRHLENLIPLAGPDAAPVPAANAAVVPQNGAAGAGTQPRLPNGQLDETQVAARLLELQRQRQAQPGWLITQIRRVEHAALLFVASLIPGVGERHITARNNAAREAEAAAEAERRRVEAENVETGAAANREENVNGANVGEQQLETAVGGEARNENPGPNAEIQHEVPLDQPLVV